MKILDKKFSKGSILVKLSDDLKIFKVPKTKILTVNLWT